MTQTQILVVEDEFLVAEDVCRKLERLGYGVAAMAATGEEAIQLAAELRPGLVLMDIGLPGEMNGVDAAAEIRTRFDMPVVYLTAHSDEDTLARAKLTGPFGYVPKPFDTRDLRSTLEMALYKHEQEKKVKESEKRYRSLFDGVPVGLYRTTPDGQILDANPAMVEMLGYPDRETLLALNVRDGYVNAADRARWQATMQRAGAVREFEAQVRRYDGATIWVRDSARAVCDAEGRVLHYDGAMEDITEHKQSEETLRTLARQWQTTFDAVTDSVCLIDLEGNLLQCNAATAALLGRSPDELTSRKCWELVHGTSEPHDDCPITRMVESRRRESTQFQIGDRWLEVTVDPVLDQDETLVGAVHLIADVTERIKTAEALRSTLAEAERGRQMLLALGQAAQVVQRAHTPDDVYRSIGDELDQLGHRVVVFDLPPERDRLTVPYSTVEPTRRREAREVAETMPQDFSVRLVPGGFHDRIVSQGQALFVENIVEPMAGASPEVELSQVEQMAASLGVERGIYAPLLVGDEPSGMLLVTGSALTQADVPAITAFANQASIALENARLFEQVAAGRGRLTNLSRRLLDAQETERRHIARELHDQIGQALTVIKINLQAAKRFAASESAPYLSDGIHTVEGALQQVRGLSLDLRPSLLDDLGLVPALRWYLDRQARQAGFSAQLSCDLQDRLPPDVEIVCFRLVQEALTNAMRHAGASEVHVELQRGAEGLHLAIRDNGRGFDVPAAWASAALGQSMGLLGMEERVQLLGGRLEIESAPGRGTVIRASWAETGLAAAAPNAEKEHSP